ncbi:MULTISPECIES: hypothetical protein [Inquilinus]|uniref:Uncharacterized protein n=1 Tax=Inquilinus ginsengisoli TaxID=363840 RepID=A0ABU1JUC3_9PROT|nr:hypothetical protein [Inquilinus ginsengisoli]MDR6291180.1 hypothetical protein [Inquilinus ginsengisoli]
MHGPHHHHDHPHHHDHDHPHDHGHGHHHHPAGPGHNGPAGRAVQWQTPHRPGEPDPAPAPRPADLDLVEAAFVEGFARAPDATSFLRLAGIAFVGEDAAGRRLHLLRVEAEDVVDVGSVAPLLGGGGMRYDPLPAQLTSRRRRLGFVYQDGPETRRLGFAEARALRDRSDASTLDLTGGDP